MPDNTGLPSKQINFMFHSTPASSYRRYLGSRLQSSLYLRSQMHAVVTSVASIEQSVVLRRIPTWDAPDKPLILHISIYSVYGIYAIVRNKIFGSEQDRLWESGLCESLLQRMAACAYTMRDGLLQQL